MTADDNRRLDLEILLAHTLGRSRAYLYTHPEAELTPAQGEQFATLARRRNLGEPVAYLTGQQAFWSFDLKVTPDTLIPRPETELLVETVLQQTENAAVLNVLELGTGTGAISLALAMERPNWHITAVDISPAALTVAHYNADRYRLTQIKFLCSDWFSALSGERFDIIVANPPYIAPDDPHLAALRYEPPSALVACSAGLACLRHIIQTAPDYLVPGGRLYCEHGATQGELCINLLKENGYSQVEQHYDINEKPRVVAGLL